MKEFIKDKKNLFIIGGVIFLVIIGAIWFYFYQSNDKIVMMDPEEKQEAFHNEDETISKEEPEEVQAVEEEESPKEIMVHIAGQVNHPGVVILKEGARLIDAIEEVGGSTPKAQLDVVNLAKKLVDEEKVYIPKEGETLPEEMTLSANQTTQSENDHQININTASQEELKSLPGIGDSISSSIIEYRESNGSFKSIEEIKEVNRIGDKIFNDIKDKIKI